MRLLVTIGCDTDPDATPATRRVAAADRRSFWKGVTSGIPALTDALADRLGGRPRITWLLRADRQMLECFGHLAYPAVEFANVWNRAVAEGDEIGWHPHLWAWGDRDGCWYPELESDVMIQELSGACRAIREVFDVRSTRTGWAYSSNALMKVLADSGVAVDFSAMPRQAAADIIGPRYFWCNDWRGTDDAPYFPSLFDYQKPGPDALPILEVPVTPIPVAFHRSLARSAVRSMRGARLSRRSGPLPAALWRSARWETRTITGSPERVRLAIDRAVRQAVGGQGLFVTYFHTDELLVPALLANFVNNLLYLEHRAAAAGVVVDYRSATGVRAALSKDAEHASVPVG